MTTVIISSDRINCKLTVEPCFSLYKCSHDSFILFSTLHVNDTFVFKYPMTSDVYTCVVKHITKTITEKDCELSLEVDII